MEDGRVCPTVTPIFRQAVLHYIFPSVISIKAVLMRLACLIKYETRFPPYMLFVC
jgi:hypothetical protein